MTWKAEHTWVTGEEFPFTEAQVRRAGDRIRRATVKSEDPLEADLDLLDLYRSSHYPALRHVQARLVGLFHRSQADPQVLPITARPLKTREAVIAKLVRERTRLNKIHDIAGARIVVPTRKIQDIVVEVIMSKLGDLKPTIAKDNRDGADDHGYRAVHVVVTTFHDGIGERPAEIQVRTKPQDAWAQIVEALDAVLPSDLKHGHGPAEYKAWLLEVSAAVGAFQRGERVTMTEMPNFPPIT